MPKSAVQSRYCTIYHVFDELLQWRDVAVVLWSFSSINGSSLLSPFSPTPLLPPSTRVFSQPWDLLSTPRPGTHHPSFPRRARLPWPLLDLLLGFFIVVLPSARAQPAESGCLGPAEPLPDVRWPLAERHVPWPNPPPPCHVPVRAWDGAWDGGRRWLPEPMTSGPRDGCECAGNFRFMYCVQKIISQVSELQKSRNLFCWLPYEIL